MSYGMNYRNVEGFGGVKLDQSPVLSPTSTATGGNVSIDMSRKMDENKANTIVIIGAMVAVVGIMGFVFYKMSK